MKRIISNMNRIVACLALMVTVMNVNSTCFFISHQPRLPDSAKAMKKL